MRPALDDIYQQHHHHYYKLIARIRYTLLLLLPPFAFTSQPMMLPPFAPHLAIVQNFKYRSQLIFQMIFFVES